MVVALCFLLQNKYTKEVAELDVSRTCIILTWTVFWAEHCLGSLMAEWQDANQGTNCNTWQAEHCKNMGLLRVEYQEQPYEFLTTSMNF